MSDIRKAIMARLGIAAKATFGIWGDVPNQYRAAVDFIRKQSKPSGTAMNELKKAIKQRLAYAAQERDPGMRQMYGDDAGSLENALEYAQRGDKAMLLRAAYNMETAVRDDVPNEMFIWAGGDVNWSHPNVKAMLERVSRSVGASAPAKRRAMRPGGKANMAVNRRKVEMAASISRGIDPKKGGQWITGTWDGGTWGALVFSEPSEAYGIPEFPHISKLYMNPKGMPGFGDVVVNYDRGWDVRPSTPETKKGYQEIAKAVTAAAKKAAASGWYSRPGAKAEMAMTDVQRKAGYKWRVAYTKQLGKDQYLGGPPVTIEDDLLFATESAARQWADAMLKKGWFKGQGGGPEKVMKATVLMASRPDAKATASKAELEETEEQKAGLKLMAATDQAVSDKIRTLIKEGKPQDQAVAIALDMKRRGEI